MSQHTPFSIKRDLKGNPQLAGYGGLTVMASFHPGGFASDAEMEKVAADLVTAGNSHAVLVAALSAVIANPRSVKAWGDAEAALALAHTAQGDV